MVAMHCTCTDRGGDNNEGRREDQFLLLSIRHMYLTGITELYTSWSICFHFKL